MSFLLQHDKTIGMVGLFLFAFVLYGWGISPTIAWNDSPEFVTIAHTLDISHPSGSPTYTLLTKLVTFVPIGSLAVRVNMFSACISAISISLLFSLLYDILETSAPSVRCSSALTGSLFLLVSESFWRFAEVAEVYALQNCFFSVINNPFQST